MTLDLKDIFEAIRKRVWIIITITIACVLVSGILSFFVIKPTYEAKVSIIIGKPPVTEEGSKVDYNDVMMYQKLVKTYSQIAKSRSVAEKTISKLGSSMTSEELQNKITVTPQADTQIMEIKAQSKDAFEAAKIVNTLVSTFIERSQEVYPTGNVQIVDPAVIPDAPIKPKKVLNLAIAFVLGLMVSFGIVFLLEYMDNTIKTEGDVEKYLDLPVIGIIPKNLEE